jgi:DNA-directed RNA polymerase subunit F
LTDSQFVVKMIAMNTVEKTWIPPELMAELQQAAENAAKGISDPEEAKKACEEMDQIREQIRARHGILDIGVPAIRELRDS